MPIYELQCRECGKQEEVLCSFDELETKGCQECGGATEQVINSACSFSLKGQGWAGKDIKRVGEFFKAMDKDREEG